MRRKLKRKFVVFLSSYALFFVSYFTLITLAKYTSSLNIHGDATVAKWDVSIAGEDNVTLPTIYIGDSSSYGSYDLSVTSKSEKAVTYSAIISNVPDGVQIQVDDNEPISETNNTVTIEDLGGFAAGDINHTHNHTLTIVVPTGISPFDNQELAIDVIFNQVD